MILCDLCVFVVNSVSPHSAQRHKDTKTTKDFFSLMPGRRLRLLCGGSYGGFEDRQMSHLVFDGPLDLRPRSIAFCCALQRCFSRRQSLVIGFAPCNSVRWLACQKA